MRLAAVMLVKDEADIIDYTIEHLIREGVDHVFVQDNGSTDGTSSMLADFVDLLPDKITVIDDHEVAYRQSEKTTGLAMKAGRAGYDWIIPCDADEFWYSSFGTLREVLSLYDHSDYDVIPAELYDHISTDLDPELSPNPFVRIGWRFREPGKLHKVACRSRPDLVIEQGNHGARSNNLFPGGRQFRVREEPGLSIRHYSWRSPEQYLRKIRNGALAYAATELPEDIGEHWRMFGMPDEPGFDEKVLAHFDRWFHVDGPLAVPELLYDPAPW